MRFAKIVSAMLALYIMAGLFNSVAPSRQLADEKETYFKNKTPYILLIEDGYYGINIYLPFNMGKIKIKPANTGFLVGDIHSRK